jgi:hypothetical protein
MILLLAALQLHREKVLTEEKYRKLTDDQFKRLVRALPEFGRSPSGCHW